MSSARMKELRGEKNGGESKRDRDGEESGARFERSCFPLHFSHPTNDPGVDRVALSEGLDAPTLWWPEEPELEECNRK